ncbi:MAG TPA: hypothetical protein VLA91_13165 [Acidimicrobiia bacterium]|nr:hypothetical protein [Acidimicrobiia bacterium]
MRRRSDYREEMFRATASKQEIELLLTGSPIGNSALSDLAAIVEVMRRYESYVPSDDLVDRVAGEAAILALAGRATGVTGTKVSRRRLPALSPRVAVAALSVVMAVGMTGVAAAADSAAPGDLLYGLDRALERIGIGAGNAAERLDEADQLLSEGHTLQALEHAAEAVDGDAAASAALDIAIDRVETAENENSAAVQEKVDALLTYMSENIGVDSGVDGREFGQGIADIARGIAPASETRDPVPADSPAPGNQNQPDEGNQPGSGNQGTSNQGTGSGNSDPPGSGGNQGNENSGDGNNPGTGSNQGGGNADPPGNSGASGNGNGPPPESPSETAPGRGNRP